MALRVVAELLGIAFLVWVAWLGVERWVQRYKDGPPQPPKEN